MRLYQTITFLPHLIKRESQSLECQIEAEGGYLRLKILKNKQHKLQLEDLKQQRNNQEREEQHLGNLVSLEMMNIETTPSI
jgi:hypothetical protein